MASTESPPSDSSTKLKEDAGTQAFRIAVGSKNPCKVNAVRKAVLEVIERANNGPVDGFELDVQGFSAPSGVPDQPFGDVSTIHLPCFFFF